MKDKIWEENEYTTPTRKSEITTEKSQENTTKDINEKFVKNGCDDISLKKLEKQKKDREYHKKYREKHKERVKIRARERMRQWRLRNPTRSNSFNKNLEYHRNYKRNRRKTDIKFRITWNLRSRISHLVRGDYASESSIKSLGCSVDALKIHLESKFKPGMSWENYNLNGWHIDHIRPLVSFDLTDSDEIKKACHFSNLQPLWAKENLSKHDKW